MTTNYQKRVLNEIRLDRRRFSGSDIQYARTIGIGASIYSRLKKGETEKVLSESEWLRIGDEIGVVRDMQKREWKLAKTFIYDELEKMVKHCKIHGHSQMMVDDCGIGKTESLKAIARKMNNCFYLDCSQNHSRVELIKKLAATIGVHNVGTTREILIEIKRQLNTLVSPMVILDEFGDVNKSSLLLIKELWNASEGNVGWMMAGAQGLEKFIEKGISRKDVGFAEIYSRFSGHIIKLQPTNIEANRQFWFDLFTEVAKPNLRDKANLKVVVNKCMKASSGYRMDLRTLRNLIVVNNY